jgi:hypothetical protein
VSAELAARCTAAAAALADYRRELHTTPLTRPPGREWMLRLAAELGSVLAALDSRPAPADLDDGQREVLASALADAITYRDPGGFCPRCEASLSGLCDDHAADLGLTGAYLALARELGVEVERSGRGCRVQQAGRRACPRLRA